MKTALPLSQTLTTWRSMSRSTIRRVFERQEDPSCAASNCPPAVFQSADNADSVNPRERCDESCSSSVLSSGVVSSWVCVRMFALVGCGRRSGRGPPAGLKGRSATWGTGNRTRRLYRRALLLLHAWGSFRFRAGAVAPWFRRGSAQRSWTLQNRQLPSFCSFTERKELIEGASGAPWEV